MTDRKTNYLIMAAAICVGIVALAVGIKAVGTDQAASLIPESQWPEVAAPPPGYKPASGAQVATQVKTAVGRSEVRVALKPADHEQISLTVGRVVEAYWQGDVDAYRNVLEGQGLQLHQDFDSNQELFHARTSSVRGAAIDLERIAVKFRMRDGDSVDVQTPRDRAMTSISLKMPRGPNDVHDPASIGTDVVAVTIPAQMRDLRGIPFEGEFRLLLARRPDDGVWLVIALEVERPSGSSPVSMPPL